MSQKISNLPAVLGSALLDTDLIPVVSEGVTSSTTVAELASRVGTAVGLSEEAGDARYSPFGALTPAAANAAYAALGSGEVNTTSNVGSGEGSVAKTKVGANFPLRTIKAGTNVTITQETDTITINSSGGGGGGSGVPSSGGTFTGNVGFGGVTPIFALHAEKAVAGDALAKFRNSDATGFGVAFQTGSDLNYAIKVKNAAGTSDAVQLFGSGVIQAGPTPGAVQWGVAANSYYAPAGSGGPTIPIAVAAGVRMFNGPVGGDATRLVISNADVTGVSAVGGPNQQTGIGISDGAIGSTGNSTGRIRMNYETARSDGGWSWATNRFPGAQRSGTGNASLSGSSVTFSSSQTGIMSVGDAFWVTLPAGSYSNGAYNVGLPSTQGFTLFTIATDGLSGTFTPIQDIGTATGALAILFTTANPQADPNRGSMKWGTDSAGDFFGFQYQQPNNSTNVPTNHLGDYNFLIYPGGIIDRTSSGSNKQGYTSNIDLVSIHPNRGIRFGTSNESSKGAYKSALWLTSHNSGLPNTAGHAIFGGKAQFLGGKAGERSALRIGDNVGAPDVSSQIEDGDIWRIGSTLYLRVGGVGGTTKSITFS